MLSSGALHVGNKVEKLIVMLIVNEGNNGHPVLNLEGKGIDGVVDKYKVFQVAVAEYAEILHKIVVLCAETMLAVESELKELLLRINVVQDRIRIALLGGCEDADLKELVGFC